MGDFSDFLWYLFIFFFSPFCAVMILLLIAWIWFIVIQKKKYEGKTRTLLTLLGVIVGILIVIAYPLGCTIFSGPVRFM